MNPPKKYILIALVLFALIFFGFFQPPRSILAVDEGELQKKIDEYIAQIGTLQKKEESLSNEIKLKDSQISLTTLKITQTEGQVAALEVEIGTLSGRIVRLDQSLNNLAKILISRIVESYKISRSGTIVLLLSSKNFSDFVLKRHFLQAMQIHDRQLLLSMETTRTNYDDQKKLKEEAQLKLEKLQTQLLAQKKQLAVQIDDRKKLLNETRGKEAEYQNLLATSRSELEAIQGIAAGQGNETSIRQVNEGERIASVIYGSSPCSSGTHLHFEVREGEDTKNPFSYLKSQSLTDDSDGDPHDAVGSWNWPLNTPIRFTQGYGSVTSAIRSRIVYYKFHTGIDIVSDDLTVKAVKAGELYRGGIACGKGTLRYVRLKHKDSGINTYYLHVNY